MSMKTVRKVAIQLIQCLFYLKNEGFIHADLKPENILMTGVGANLTVCDFGNAVHVKDANIYYDTFEVQSLFYRAPEVVIGLEFNTAIDMWSVGCILAEMLLGTPLFSCRNNAELLESMMDVLGPPPLSYSKGKFYTKYFTEGHHLIAASSSRYRYIALTWSDVWIEEELEYWSCCH
jgi:serine/threonine protein kinase